VRPAAHRHLALDELMATDVEGNFGQLSSTNPTVGILAGSGRILVVATPCGRSP